MSLIRTSALNGIAVLVRLATVLLLNKVLAVFVGPGGYGVIGQFQSAVSMLGTFASGAVNVGVTKYTAEYRDDPQRSLAVWRTAATMGLGGAALFATLLLVLREPLAGWILADRTRSPIIVWLASALALMVFNGLMLAVLNGRKAVGAYVTANICGSLVGAASSVALVSGFGLAGALIAVAINQGLACGVTAVLFHRAGPFPWRRLLGRIDWTIARKLSGFALMSLTTALVVPATQIAIRGGLSQHLGWTGAGYWQALNKISETHLLLLTSTLSVYFLPRFSEIRDAHLLRKEVVKGYRFVLPLVGLSATTLFLMRRTLVSALLTGQFMPLIDVMGWQLLGDVLKIGSWVLAYTMVSHARTRAFVVTEVCFAGLLCGLTLWFSAMWGLRGTALAYCATYATYWIVMAILFKGLARRLSDVPATTAEVGMAT